MEDAINGILRVNTITWPPGMAAVNFHVPLVY